MAINEREIVLDMLIKIEKGAMSHTVLKEGLDNLLYLEKSNRAFIARLFEGSVEKRIYLDYVIGLFSKTALPKMKPLIRSVLRMTVYQILFMDRVPDSAAINEAVKLVKKRGFIPLSGFVNGVLRTVSREKENLLLPDKEKEREKYLSVLYSMPEFLMKRFLRDYGEEAEVILSSFTKERKLTIRVNENRTDRESLLQRLAKEGVIARKGHLPHSIILEELDNLAFLQSFEDGDFFVQDESSQLVAELTPVKKGDRVIDLCAAPGGKTMALSMKAGRDGEVRAFDVSDYKLSLIEDNIERLGLENVTLGLNDASEFNEALREIADVILCDLPCSGLGVMGRKKDIRYHLSEEKIAELSKLQKKMLENALQYIKVGGYLIFSTCTMTKEENEENFAFLKSLNELEPVDFSKALPKSLLNLEVGDRYLEEAQKGFLRILPHDFDSDGFFISKFIRKK